MKKIILIIALIFTVNSVLAQDVFVRSSLSMILVENPSIADGKGPLVEAAYRNYKFPESVYNNHKLPQTTINLDSYKLTPEEEAQFGVKKSEAGQLLGAVASEATAGIVQDDSQVEFELQKYIKQNRLAHEQIIKWFNIKEDGSFNLDYVTEMINLQLTEEQKLTAVESGSQQAAIDANREYLINNTYTVFTRLNFVSNEPIAAAIRNTAVAIATEKLGEGMPLELAKKAAEKIYEKTKEGYSVWTNGWLFDLQWGAEEWARFESCVNKDTKQIDLDKFYAQEFKLNYVGKEKATSLVTFSLKKGEGDRTEEQIIDLSTNRNVDKVLVKLQRAYDQFMPIFPLQQDKPIGAFLGVKEGIEGGEKFEVLGPFMKDTGEYKVLGTITVDKKNVWDNSYGSTDEKGMTLFTGKLPKLSGKDFGTKIRQKR
jgi:hypothetical protein